MTNPLLINPQLQTVTPRTTDQTSLFTGIGVPNISPWQQSQVPQQQQMGYTNQPNYQWMAFSNLLGGLMSSVSNSVEMRDQKRYEIKQSNPLLQLPETPNTSKQQQFGMDYYEDGGIIGEDPLTAPKGYKASTLQQRKDWNAFLDFLDEQGVQGSKDLDKRDQNMWMGYMDQFRSANPNTTINASFVPIAQYEGTLLRRGTEIPNVASRKVVDRFSSVLGDPWKKTISPVDNWVGSITSKMYYPRISKSKDNPAFDEDYQAYDNYISGVAKMNCGGKVYNKFKVRKMDEGGFTGDMDRDIEKDIEDSIFAEQTQNQVVEEVIETPKIVEDTYDYGDPIVPSSEDFTTLQPAVYKPLGRNIPEMNSNQAVQAFKNGIAGSEGADYFGTTNIKGKDGKPISSAFGKYQFLKGTREGVRKQFFPDISQKDFENAYKTSPEFQERVMDVYSGHLLNKFGDPERAALAFFMGEGANVSPLNRNYKPTPENASVGQYLDRFNRNYKYRLGGTYELDNNQIALLKSQGYKIEYL